MIQQFHIIAFTHRNIEVTEIGNLHVEMDVQATLLPEVKASMQLDELMFLSTCNRVEISFCTQSTIDHHFLSALFKALYPSFSESEIEHYVSLIELHSGIAAVEHLLSVASSIDSMVVGEREIITQVRNAFEYSRKIGITGDFIRILMRHTIETAKKVYTQTSIATKPVSVVSLAYHKLRDMNIPLNARVLIVGAGQTNTNMSRFLKKHGFKNFTVFNRTFEKAQNLAKDLNGTALPLENLSKFEGGFDVLICCTGTDHHLITEAIYTQLKGEDQDKKVVIDLALPQDLHPNILQSNAITHISIQILQKISNENLKERSKEIQHVEEIIQDALFEFNHIQKMRSVELAMRDVPLKIKEIKQFAMNELFKNELEGLDENSKEILEKIVGYMEKKYMSMPMKMAKEILLNH